MSDDEITTSAGQEVEVLFEQKPSEITIEPPIEEWSSYLCFLRAPDENQKRRLFEEGLYDPPSEEICAKYIPLSDSSVYRHPYYKYPAVEDPGIEDALLQPPPEIIYPDDGQDLYEALCKEMNEPFSKLFHKQLLKSHMNMNYYGISPYGWRPMAMALKKNRIVQTIDFTSNFISIDGCYHIGDMLSNNFTITELNFTGCRMGPEGMKNLVASFRLNTTLRKLNVGRNCLNDAGVQYLCNELYKGSHVSDIGLSYNGLTSETAKNLADALEFMNNITKLDLSFNSFTVPKPVEALISRFLESDFFVEINFSWNSLTNRFATSLSNLIRCPKIQVVNLSNNNLTGDVITQIADNLKFAKNLKTLDLSFNPLTVAEANYILNKMRFRGVKLNELLMDNVTVDLAFENSKNRILEYKFRKGAVITHGYVVPKKEGANPDLREIVLRRSDFLCQKGNKDTRKDIAQVILKLDKETKGEPIFVNTLNQALKNMGVHQLNRDLVDAITDAFPGPSVGKIHPASMRAAAEYMYMVDFQAVRYGSPALDLSYILYLCLEREQRSEHLDSLLEYYVDELHKRLLEMSDEASIFHTSLNRNALYELLQEEFKRAGRFALGIALDMYPIMMCDSSEAPNLYQEKESGSAPSHDDAKPVFTVNAQCRRKMTDLVMELVDAGVV
ncbi:ecdysteroid kinase domain-containing protein [Phthorimaea operculella]|nr:ecdysteroid kinase domain-containing protein [Phthorimaea operculella]